jgi:hypothetical protein
LLHLVVLLLAKLVQVVDDVLHRTLNVDGFLSLHVGIFSSLQLPCSENMSAFCTTLFHFTFELFFTV